MEDGPEGPPSKMEPRPKVPGQCLEGVADSSFRVAKKKTGGGPCASTSFPHVSRLRDNRNWPDQTGS